MTRYEIIQGLKFTIDMFLFDPSTGEEYTEPRNDMDKITIDACRGAIELLEEPRKDEVILTKKEYGELVSSEFDNGYAKGYEEALEQQEILDKIRDEVEQLTFEYDKIIGIDDTRTDAEKSSDWWKMEKLIVLQIIDKYKAECEEV